MTTTNITPLNYSGDDIVEWNKNRSHIIIDVIGRSLWRGAYPEIILKWIWIVTNGNIGELHDLRMPRGCCGMLNGEAIFNKTFVVDLNFIIFWYEKYCLRKWDWVIAIFMFYHYSHWCIMMICKSILICKSVW